jgi:hypothetical protein
LSWELCVRVLDHPRPIFAPITAIVAMGFTAGRRGRAALLLVLGVAIGIRVGDVRVRMLDRGGIQIAVVVFVAMTLTPGDDRVRCTHDRGSLAPHRARGGAPRADLAEAIDTLSPPSIHSTGGWRPATRCLATGHAAMRRPPRCGPAQSRRRGSGPPRSRTWCRRSRSRSVARPGPTRRATARWLNAS